MIPYRSINPYRETRVLRIAPPKHADDKEIVCSLEHTSLSSPIAYEALSYCWSKSLNGRMTGIDPETEVHGWFMNHIGVSKTMVTAKIKDLYEHPRLQNVMFSSGVPRPSGKIIVDGVTVEVGGELLAALRRLRRLWAPSEDSGERPEGIAVWIDALCINQSDIEERNQHVTQMGEIYRKAKVVRIWLGEEVSGADQNAFNTLGQILELLDDMYKEEVVNDAWKLQMYMGRDPRTSAIEWTCLSSILDRAWFQRTWVIQEIGFAPQATVHLGSLSCSWRLLSTVIRVLRELDLDTPLWATQELTANTTIALMDRLHRTHGLQEKSEPDSPDTLLDILHDSRAFQCTVKSDKVYGVLGLACDASDYPAPDYSLPAMEVFKSVATTHIARTQSLAILYHCSWNEPNEDHVLDLPSWAPDWTQKCHHTPFYLRRLRSQAAKQSPATIEVVDNVLRTRGRLVQTISAVDLVRKIPRNSLSTPKADGKIPDANGEELPLFKSPDMRPTDVQDWLGQFQENQKAYINNIMKMAFPQGLISAKVFENLWRTFVCNETTERQTPLAEWGTQFSHFVACLNNGADGREAWLEEVIRDEGRAARRSAKTDSSKWDLTEKFETHGGKAFNQYYDYVKANGMWCYNRRFFKCGEGEFGWGPDGAREGDVVAVINGLAVPLVLRPVSAGGFRVIGDCYCHGIMQGESVDMVEQQDIDLV